MSGMHLKTWSGVCAMVLLAGCQGTGEKRIDSAPTPVSVPLMITADASVLPGRNLMPNPSLEEHDGAVPAGWSWSQGRADATCVLTDDARSGESALHFVNKTPRAPHVFGKLALNEPACLTPKKSYVLSAYVKGEGLGGWIGGRAGWNFRIGFPRKTDGRWLRVHKSFIAGDSDKACNLLMVTEAVTSGFSVDDIKLEEGTLPTAFLPPDIEDRKAAVFLDVPPSLGCRAGEDARLPAVVWSKRPMASGAVTAELTDSNGHCIGEASNASPLPQGLNGLAISFPATGDLPGSMTVRISFGGETAQTEFELHTGAHYQKARQQAAAATNALRALVEQARARDIPADYARAALVISKRFSRIAQQKHDKTDVANATRDMRFIATLCEQQACELRSVLDGRRTAWTIPDPDLSDLTIHDGNFWAGDEPVMLIGGMGYGELKEDFEDYRDYGFNNIDCDFVSQCAFRMVTGEKDGKPTFDEGAIPVLKEWCKRCADKNLPYSFNPTLHYFPGWALQAYPDITGGDPVDRLPDWSGRGRHAGKRIKTYGAFFPFAIDSPSVRRLVSAYYARLMPELRNVTGHCTIWLMNEPTYQSRDAHTVDLFRSALREKYGNIAALNAAWGTDLASFSEIQNPTEANSPATFDWRTFQQNQVADWFEWLAGEIRKHHPKAVLSNKPMAWTLLHPDKGIDFEREAELWDVPGCDAGRRPLSDAYSFGWAESVLLFDFQKSVAPDKPLVDLEYHYCHDPNLSSDYARATYFQSYLHGLRKSEFWVWAAGELDPTKPTGAGMHHTAWSQPKIAWGTSSAALDMRRLGRVFAAFPTPPQAMIYFSRPSLYLDESAAQKGIHLAHQAANSLDATVGFITDKMIRAGKINNCKLLIVPNARRIEADVRTRIAEFASNGGHVLLVNDCLEQSEHGKTYENAIAGANVRHADAVDPQGLVAAVDSALERAGADRPVRAVTRNGKPAWPIECRTTQVDGRRICYLVGLNKEPMSIRLRSKQRIAGWTDLLTGKTGKGASFTLEPLDVKILELR